MLRQLEERQHFVDSAHMFSLQDLIDVNNGILVEYLTKVHTSFASHIKNECLVSCAVLCVGISVLAIRISVELSNAVCVCNCSAVWVYHSLEAEYTAGQEGRLAL